MRAGAMTRTRKCDDPYARTRASKCTRALVMQNLIQKKTTTTQQTENVMKNETKPPYFLFFQKICPQKMFHKNISPKKFYHEKMNPYLVQIYYFLKKMNF